MEWLGRARVSFTTAHNSLKVTSKDGKSTSTLQQICEESTPPCYLNPLLFNGHLQTMYTVVKEEGPAIYYKRKIYDQEDPVYEGTFAVDYVAKPFPETDETLPPRTTYFSDEEYANFGSLDSRPMLIALHGLSGGSYEIYLRQVLAPLVENGEWEACVINSRGCAMHKITTTVLYNGRATWDIRQMVKYFRKMFPNRPLFGIGFSLGANMMTNYIGEEGEDCLLKAAVVISSPWNLDISNHGLMRGFIGRYIYSRTLGTNMKKLYNLHHDQISKNPKIRPDVIRNITYLHEFDAAIQCPTWGYPTASAYYRDASSVDSMLAVRIPLLAINAVDDPVVHHEALPLEEFKLNPYAVLCTTSMGGHLSWFEWSGTRWHAKPATNFLNHIAFKVDLDLLAPPKVNEEVKLKGKRKLLYSPMRRKLYVEGSDYKDL